MADEKKTGAKEDTRTKEETTTNTNEQEYIIQLDRDSCIGTTACIAQHPTEWKLSNDGKVNLSHLTTKNDDVWERTITSTEYEQFLKSARACPVNAIRIINKKTGERIV